MPELTPRTEKQSSGLETVLAVLATLGTLAVAVLAVPTADTIIARGVGEAVERAPVLATPQGADTGASLWLSRHETDLPLGLAGAVAVGDRITLSQRDGASRVLEVREVREISVGVTHTEAAPSPRLLMVTCTVVGDPTGRTVQFIVGAGEAEGAPKAGQRTAL
jgi:hypothetical protein